MDGGGRTASGTAVECMPREDTTPGMEEVEPRLEQRPRMSEAAR